MALPAGKLFRISLGGKLAQDTWSINIWGDGSGMTGDPSPGNLSDFAAECIDVFQTTVWNPATNALKAANASSVGCSTCHIEYYVDGAIQLSADNSITDVVGTGSSPHPGYTALCATLLTDLAGRSRRGRVYLPATALGVSATNLQQNGSPQAYANNLAAALGALQTLSGILPGDPAVPAVIVSRTHALKTPITQVRMDSIFDTIRGRQSKFIPATTVFANV